MQNREIFISINSIGIEQIIRTSLDNLVTKRTSFGLRSTKNFHTLENNYALCCNLFDSYTLEMLQMLGWSRERLTATFKANTRLAKKNAIKTILLRRKKEKNRKESSKKVLGQDRADFFSVSFRISRELERGTRCFHFCIRKYMLSCYVVLAIGSNIKPVQTGRLD